MTYLKANELLSVNFNEGRVALDQNAIPDLLFTMGYKFSEDVYNNETKNYVDNDYKNLLSGNYITTNIESMQQSMNNIFDKYDIPDENILRELMIIHQKFDVSISDKKFAITNIDDINQRLLELSASSTSETTQLAIKNYSYLLPLILDELNLDLTESKFFNPIWKTYLSEYSAAQFNCLH